MREPPVRLVYEDIGKNPDCQNVRIYLDGVQIKECTGFDVNEGWVEFYDGVDLRTREFRRTRKHGEVRVEWTDPRKVL